jgi:hypothetical protein
MARVRVPVSYLRAGLAGLSGSGRAARPRVQPILRPAGGTYNRLVTVDLGNDGMASLVTFGAAGTAQAFIGPAAGGDLWSLDQCYLSTSIGQLDTSQVIFYAGPLPLAQYARTGSLSGGSQQFGLGGVTVPFGWFAWALWTGGTAGATAQLTLTGQKTVLTN